MLLLVAAIVLVLIGVVTLIIGIFSDTLVWVFVSIGSTVLAGIVLYVLYRLGRRQVSLAVSGVETSAAQPAPEPTAAVPVSTAAVPVPVPAAAVTAAAPVAAAMPAFAGAESGPGRVPHDEFAPAVDEFPIAEYDELRVAEILPLLPELEPDELAVVRDREVATKGRETILARIDELEGAPGAAVAATNGRAPLPIADYDTLRVADILPLLSELDADELEAIAEHEEGRGNRQTVLSRVDALLDAIDARALAGVTELPAPPKTASATKAPAKTAASKATTKTATAPAKKGPAKTAASKATTRTATAPAKKGPAKTAASKATTRTATAPATKAAAKATAPATRAATKAATAPAKKAPAKTAPAAAKRPAAKSTAAAKKAPAAKAPATSAAAKKAPAVKAPAVKAPAKKAGGTAKG